MKCDILSIVIENPDFSVVSTFYRDEAIQSLFNSNNFEIALSVGDGLEMTLLTCTVEEPFA